MENLPQDMMTPACVVVVIIIVRLLFWDSQRHNNHRLDVHWDRVEHEKILWIGEVMRGKSIDRLFPSLRFLRGEGLKGKEMLFDLVESGRWQTSYLSSRTNAKQHCCSVLSYTRGYGDGQKVVQVVTKLTIKITLVGMVDQSPTRTLAVGGG